MKLLTKEEYERYSKIVINHKDFKDVKTIYESWFYDKDSYEDIIKEEIKKLQIHLREFKKERKLQPIITCQSVLGNETKELQPGYQILINNDKNGIFYMEDW